MKLLRTICAAAVVACLAVPSWADARLTVLMDLLRLDDVVGILRSEGFEFAKTLEDDMLDGQGGAFWQVQVDRIYGTDRMAERIRSGFENSLQGPELAATIAFFGSDLGGRIIALENAARQAMMDADVEEAARAVYVEMRAANDPKLDLLDQYVSINQMMDRNVTAAMSSNLAFYRGLADGDFTSMSSEEMLEEVWSQEAEIRADAESWLYGFLLLAYQPLEPGELEAYVAFSSTSAGQTLNSALFAGHEEMYREISYALGRAVALSTDGSTL